MDRDAVVAGALVAVGLALPITLAVAAADLSDDSAWQPAALAGVVIVFFGAGWRTGSLRPTLPMANGALAGLIGFVVVQLLLVPVSLFTDDGFDVGNIPALVFIAFLMSNIAMLGALFGDIVARRDLAETR